MKSEFVVAVFTKGENCLAKRKSFWKEGGFLKYFKSRYEAVTFLPKGLKREDETPEAALERLCKKECEVKVNRSVFLGKFAFKEGVAHVYVVSDWTGSPSTPKGCDKLVWIHDAKQLTNEFDRLIFERFRMSLK